MRKSVIFAAVVLALFMSASDCEKKGKDAGPGDELKGLSQSELWSRAERNMDAETFDAYLSAYPRGPHAKEAEEELMKIWDQKTKSMTEKDMEELTAVIETDKGTIKFELFPHDAPGHCRNFIKLAQSRFYDGLIFHRVVDGFVVQGGDPRGNGTGGPGYTIDAEFNDRHHKAGTVAMARGSAPDSAGSQFYICLAPQPMLDGRYTVFGQVIEGMDVVREIGKAKTGARDKPEKDQVMERVYIQGL